MRDKIFTTTEIARMLEMNPTTINNYIDGNLLKAFRTPGGHRRVKGSDFIEFLKSYSIPVPEEITGGLQGLRVQIIDDDIEFSKWLREELLLFAPDITVHCNDNGYTGLLDISEVKPDLLVLDYVMPPMNGTEFLESFRNHERFKSTDVVVVTGFPEPGLKTKVLGLGARAFFTKPLDLDEFLTFFRGQYEVKDEPNIPHRT